MGNLEIIENRESVEALGEFAPLEPGTYRVEIANSEVADTKTGGKMLKVTWEVQDQKYRGRLVWGNFNIVNASEKAQAIGRGQLASLAKACGLLGIPEDSMSLHNIPHLIRVVVESKEGYEPRNVVKGFYPVDKKKPEAKVESKTEDDLDQIPF